MTGFGRYYRKGDGKEILVEVRSLNHRFLKVNINLPERFMAYEDRVLKTVRSRLHRGVVDLRLRLRNDHTASEVGLNQALLDDVVASWREAADRCGLPADISAQALFQVPGLIGDAVEDLAGADDAEWEALGAGLDKALDALVAMRVTEGATMATDLAERIRQIGLRLKDIEVAAPAVLSRYQEKIQKNVNRLLGEAEEAVGIDELRREIAVFAERADIHEECLRIRSHLAEFSRILAVGGRVGRKMEFLTQELLR